MIYDNDDKFITKWQTINEKGIKIFLISYATNDLVVLVGYAILLYFVFKDNVSFILKYSILLFLCMILGAVFQWFRNERKYKNLLKLMKKENT